MKRTSFLAALAFLTALPLTVPVAASAQTQTPGIRARQDKQQKRIENGVKSGELTPAETAKLTAEQRKIQAEKKVAKADGEVTPAERAVIQHDQNKASRHIRKQKHDAQKRN